MISYYSTYAIPHAAFNKAVSDGYSTFDTVVIEQAEKIIFKVYAYAEAGNVGNLSVMKLVLEQEYTPSEFKKSKAALLANSTEVNLQGEAI